MFFIPRFKQVIFSLGIPYPFPFIEHIAATINSASNNSKPGVGGYECADVGIL